MEIVVFTNGCFDLLHPGHIRLLKKARSLGTKLIVGLNSDRSVRAIKGSPRPFLDQESRAAVLSELKSVDQVMIFDENTPENLIKSIKPDVLVKGGDWKPEQIVGADFVLNNGGQVFSIPFETDISTSKIVENIQSQRVGSFAENRKISDSDFQSLENTVSNYLYNSIAANEYLLKNEVSNIERGERLIKEASREQGNIWILRLGKLRKFASADGISLNKKIGLEGILADSEDLNKSSGLAGLSKFDVIIFISETAVPDTEAKKNNDRYISILMNARNIGCRIIGLFDEREKKIAGICDLAIYLPKAAGIQSAVKEIVFDQWFREYEGNKQK